MRALRPRRHDPVKAYRRTVDRAYRRVPFYREQWAETGDPTPIPVAVPAAELAARHRFTPVGEAAGEHPVLRGRELYEALLFTERYSRDDTVFDVQPGLRDLTSIGPDGSGRYRVVLTHDAEVDPHAENDLRRTTFTAYTSTARRVLLGDARQLAGLGLEPQTVDGDQILLRGGVTELARLDVLYDEDLGYLGARRSCGSVHLNPRRVDVRMLDGLVVFSRTDRDNPTLLHIAPTGGAAARLGRCGVHDEPVLLAGDMD
ncbi:MAG TPA: hypothetical protein H9881_08295 [Candidatus Stackebrandtia excrementipullorum]|nr:hypothetical protein [Candidatus Stackebrandtia excrementipullorum]